MPQFLHADLISAKFPYNYSELSSTVVVNRGLESQRQASQSFHGAEAAQSEGIPQAYYMENVLPTARGYTSVAYTQVIGSLVSDTPILLAFEIRGTPVGLAILAITSTQLFIYDSNGSDWVELTVPTYDPGATVTANVKGITYIFISGAGVYTYDFTSKLLVEATLLGADIGELAGIFSAGAVLGAWTQDLRILWSSIFDPLDFVPSLSTGAGSTSVLAITSPIITVLPLGEDFIIYTATNAVSGRQTGNVQFPFTFAEVVGSCGIAYPHHVAYNSNSGVHVTYSASGFQNLNTQEAQFIWPELSEGLQRGIRIELEPVLLHPQYRYDYAVDVKLQFNSNRFITISLRNYNESTVETEYTEAHVFDTQLNRWGRLVVNHTCMLEYTLQAVEGLYTYDELEADYLTYTDLEDEPDPKLSYSDIDSNPVPVSAKPGANFGVVGTDGKVHIMAPSQTSNFRGDNEGIASALPRIFLGKYKIVREQGILLQGIRVNKLIAAGIIAHGHGYDGSYVRQVENFVENPVQPGNWMQVVSADSISLEFFGSFHISDLTLICESAGVWNQFAVPPRKKFYSYINSVVYPAYVTDSFTTAGRIVEASLERIYIYAEAPRDDFKLECIIAEGFMPTVLDPNNTILFPEDKLHPLGILVDGALVVTIIHRYETLFPEDKFKADGSLVSGTLVITIAYIYWTIYQEDKFTATGSLISGTLI